MMTKSWVGVIWVKVGYPLLGRLKVEESKRFGDRAKAEDWCQSRRRVKEAMGLRVVSWGTNPSEYEPNA